MLRCEAGSSVVLTMDWAAVTEFAKVFLFGLNREAIPRDSGQTTTIRLI